MGKLTHYIQGNGTNIAKIIAGVFVLTLLSASILPVFAEFNPGDTLDPGCLPSDPDCTVLISSGATTTWGAIIGDVADQTDLQSVLDGKVSITDFTASSSEVFDAEFASRTTDDLAEGSVNRYYATTLFDIDFATKSTDDLTEGSNQYYTDAKVDGRIASLDTLNTLTAVPNLDTIGTITSGVWEGTSIADGFFDKSGDWTGTFGGNTPSYYLDATNLTNTSGLFAAGLAGITTDDLAQGSTNLYYDESLVDARVDVVTTLNNLTSAPNLSGVGTISSGVWNGTAIADGYFDKSGDWTGTFGGNAPSYYLDATNLTNTNSIVASGLATLTSDDLIEGSINQYYTAAKVNALLFASSSIVKTYSNNIFSGSNTFTGALTFSQFPQKSGSLIPTNDYDFTPKSYVDSLIVGQSARGSAMVVTTEPLPAVTYDNGSSGVGATLTADSNGTIPMLDSMSIIMGARILVKDQVDPSQNGVYIATQLGDGSNPFILTRADDYDSPSEVTNGSFIPITSGLLYSNTVWIMTSVGAMTVGSTDINFTQLSISPASYTASNGIKITSNNFQADIAPNEGITLAGSSLKVDYDNSTIGIVNNQLAALNIASSSVNSLPYYATAGNILSGASGIFTTGTKLGIGTSSPTAYLDIDQTVAGSLNALAIRNQSGSSNAYSLLQFSNDTANGAGILFNSSARTTDAGTNGLTLYNDAGGLRFRTNGATTFASGAYPGTDRMTITSTGNVGIGTTTPGALLSVAGTVYTSGSIGVGTTTPVAKLSIVAGGASGTTNGLLMTDSTGVGKFTVLDNGRMGVGTTTAITAGLVSNFTGLIGGANQSAYDIGAGRIAAGSSIYSYGSICTQNTLGTCTGSNGVVIGSTTANTLARVNIPSSGTSFFTDSVAIGTTTAAAKLNVGSGSGFTSYSQPTAARPIIEATNLSGQLQASIGVGVNDGTTNPRIALFADVTNNVYGLTGTYTLNSPSMVFRNAGTEHMRITSTGNIGIATTTPTEKLSVVGNILSSGNFTTAGNVMIGTTTAGAKLNVVGNAIFTQSGATSSAANLYVSNDLGVGLRGIAYGSGYTAGSAFSVGANGSALVGTGENAMAVGTFGVAQPLIFGTNSLERMRIQSNGNIAIGTSSANFLLQLYTNTNPYIQFTNSAAGSSGTDGSVVGMTSTLDLQVRNRESTGIVTLFTNDVERFRVSATGNVGIGTTTPANLLSLQAASPALSVTATTKTTTTIGNKNSRLLLLNDTTTTNAGSEVVFGYTDTDVDRVGALGFAAINNAVDGGTGRVYIATKSATTDTTLTERLSILPNGNIGFGSTNPTAKFLVTQSSIVEASKQPIIALTGTYTGPYTSDITANSFTTILQDMNITTNKAVYSNPYATLMSGTSSSDGAIYTLYSRPYMQGSGSFASVEGVTVDPYFYGAGASGYWANYTGLRVSGGAYGGGATGNASVATQIRIANPSIGTTTKYGVRIDSISGAATNYAVYSAGGQSYHAGNFGLGSTTPAYQLTVAGSVGFTGLSSATSSYAALCLNTANGQVFVNTGTQTCTVSSERFKHNIETLTADSGLDLVQKLRPVSFTLNGTSEERLGFVAEEVNELDSRLVGFEADGVTPRTVRYEEMTAVLAKAVQELDKKIAQSDFTLASSSSFTASVAIALSSITEWIGQKITATVGSFEKVQVERGIEMRDQKTGDVYCVTIEDGKWEKNLGSCEDAVVEEDEDDTEESIPEIEETEEIATTTDLVIDDTATSTEEESNTIDVIEEEVEVSVEEPEEVVPEEIEETEVADEERAPVPEESESSSDVTE